MEPYVSQFTSALHAPQTCVSKSGHDEGSQVVGVPTLVVVTPSKSSSTPASVAALLIAASTSAVELLEIAPTEEVQRAMNQQITAERLRRADIVSADGYRLQSRMQAEGNCESKKAVSKGQGIAIATEARGSAEARKIIAQAETDALKTISDAIKDYGVNGSQYTIAMRYIETMHMIASHASKRHVYFPYEADVIGALSHVTSS